ncbi:MAG TPA: pirin family protein [Cellvibrionaceae bacterium]|nr:pirin family protein [Cellvibrionaceae bacterium]HMW70843.1 pirin family protein [Cellvibrionaceae bacterium]HMY37736.1 pirin family protein [Marinagarivorans sp.]HNG58187.1 pirin family protein [Cellvibrionaceae bacterium]
MSERTVVEMLAAQAASDGDGVRLLRVFGGGNLARFDPFLMLDEFGSESADDYIGGFPPHPHRGFETITYMLQGKMEHRDHLGNQGLLSDGDVQWMTAAHGIIHSEMPKQTAGKMRGFQIWLNLPAKNKLAKPAWQDLPASKVPEYAGAGFRIKAIAGSLQLNELWVEGAFQRPDTRPIYWDIHLEPQRSITIPLPDQFTGLLYTYEGMVNVGAIKVKARQLARLNDEGELVIHNHTQEEARLLVLAGAKLKEPIVQYGPFVMNTREEIEQAMSDYRDGTLAL